MTRLTVAVCALAVAGCGDDDTTTYDAGVSVERDASDGAVEPGACPRPEGFDPIRFNVVEPIALRFREAPEADRFEGSVKGCDGNLRLVFEGRGATLAIDNEAPPDDLPEPGDCIDGVVEANGEVLTFTPDGPLSVFSDYRLELDSGEGCALVEETFTTLACGDGVLGRDAEVMRSPYAEQCDDGNSDSGDGCSAKCAQEIGWGCDAEDGCAPICANPPDRDQAWLDATGDEDEDGIRDPCDVCPLHDDTWDDDDSGLPDPCEHVLARFGDGQIADIDGERTFIVQYVDGGPRCDPEHTRVGGAQRWNKDDNGRHTFTPEEDPQLAGFAACAMDGTAGTLNLFEGPDDGTLGEDLTEAKAFGVKPDLTGARVTYLRLVVQDGVETWELLGYEPP